MKINIQGIHDSRAVFVNNRFLDVIDSQKVYNHSPDGFAWGYGGSGPAQLALAVLLLYTNKETALRNYQRFKFDIIAKIRQSDFNIDVELDPYLIKE